MSSEDIVFAACQAAENYHHSKKGRGARRALTETLETLELRLLRWIGESPSVDGELARAVLAVETLRRYAKARKRRRR